MKSLPLSKSRSVTGKGQDVRAWSRVVRMWVEALLRIVTVWV